MRDSLRRVLVGVCGLPAALLFTAVPAAASDAVPQRSATPNVTAEIGFTRAQVHPGDQDTMTVSLVNHGPQSLDDSTSVHITVTMPEETAVDPTVVETIPGNAPAGSSNAARSTRSVPLTQVFVRTAPGFFDVVVPAGSFGNSTSFRTYTFKLRVSPTAPQGAQLVGAGVAVALENYVGLSVTKSVAPPAPVVVAPSRPKSGTSSRPSVPTGAGSSEWIRRGGVVWWTGCPGYSGSGSGGNTWSGNAGSGGGASGGAGAGSGGMASGCPCPANQHMTTTAGGGARCVAAGGPPTLAETGSAETWPVALGVLALAAGALLMGVARRRHGGGNWSRP